MQVIPAIDVFEGNVVRLQQGQFSKMTNYSDNPLSVAKKFEQQGATRLHLVNLTGAKDGTMNQDFIDLVRQIKQETGLALQVGGGIRFETDVQKLIDAEADAIVIGSLFFKNRPLCTSLFKMLGPDRLILSLDINRTKVQISGWQESTDVSIKQAITDATSLGVTRFLITDIQQDGMGKGPSTALYKELHRAFPNIILTASGGIRNKVDTTNLALANVSSCVVGKTLVSSDKTYGDLLPSTLAVRIVPCLDIAGGRVVKGTKFQDLNDAGDPVELAQKYCKEGADELVFLDISATREDKTMVFELAKKVASVVNIPFTIGGGVRTIADAKTLLLSGADKVAVNSAGVQNPQFIAELSTQIGSANTVCAIDACKSGDSWIVLINGGSKKTELDAVLWAIEAVEKGAGELLVTSFDRDGTKSGFDTDLLLAIKEKVSVPVIASGGAGSLLDFVDGVKKGRADALLAASVFHYGTYSIKDVKRELQQHNIPVRLPC